MPEVVVDAAEVVVDDAEVVVDPAEVVVDAAVVVIEVATLLLAGGSSPAHPGCPVTQLGHVSVDVEVQEAYKRQ